MTQAALPVAPGRRATVAGRARRRGSSRPTTRLRCPQAVSLASAAAGLWPFSHSTKRSTPLPSCMGAMPLAARWSLELLEEAMPATQDTPAWHHVEVSRFSSAAWRRRRCHLRRTGRPWATRRCPASVLQVMRRAAANRARSSTRWGARVDWLASSATCARRASGSAAGRRSSMPGGPRTSSARPASRWQLHRGTEIEQRWEGCLT
mmetsp:Transcript_62130/g.192527  ORF Transcript_62130/g.192527 Transcript_62130/m.192527 type:complete len:206 (-) Transcript_62130:31-648(-)